MSQVCAVCSPLSRHTCDKAISQQLAELRGPRRRSHRTLGVSPRCQLREKVFLPGSTFPGCSFREMPLVTHTENISLFFFGLALVTWSSLAMDVRFRGVPPGSRSSPTVFSPYRRIEDDKEKPTRKKDHSQYEASNYCPDQSRSNPA
jgi:hypothetical protein